MKPAEQTGQVEKTCGVWCGTLTQVCIKDLKQEENGGERMCAEMKRRDKGKGAVPHVLH